MKTFAVLLIAFFVPNLSHANVERLVRHSLDESPPAVTLQFGGWTSSEGAAALARAGLARVVESDTTCWGRVYRYAASETLLQMAHARGWVVLNEADGGSLAIRIPIGRYAYMAESASILESTPTFKYIDFNYRFIPNANVKTLLFFAPAAAWFFPDMGHAAANTSLSDTRNLKADSIVVERSRSGWYARPHARLNSSVPGCPPQ